uniref:Chloroplast envelope membrane protein n=1 Tax=Codium simulans TaxID=589376 RepID=A0A1I9LKI3_9CHLO|nr:chloroplast envelope membrane protein [Codium simulans]ANJ70844.1 chloroplast envelope membrane protein [Codium simulans]
MNWNLPNSLIGSYLERYIYIYIYIFFFFLFTYMSSHKSFEKLGFIPRSIWRTTLRFCQQLLNSSNLSVLQELRFSRYQTIASLKCVVNLIVFPYLIYLILYFSIYWFVPDTYWFDQILQFNWTQKQHNYLQMQNQQDQAFFDLFLSHSVKSNLESCFYIKLIQTNQNQIHTQFTQLITNFCMFFIFWYLLIKSTPQLIILKSFCLELIYNLSDPKKAFLLILSTDLLVGFHSSQVWKLSLEILLNFLNIDFNQDSILLIISIFPVFLDTIFKYWIFRFLNKISPSTVAIYHNMIE